MLTVLGEKKRAAPTAEMVDPHPWLKLGVSRTDWIAYEHYQKAAREAAYPPVALKDYVATHIREHGLWIDYFRYRRMRIQQGQQPDDFQTWCARH
ncbi:MAG: hypothetical protein A2289_15535 [Deltaproteobacteria bacterium RIFOXYA12_FULL_58_15]|nr:MAG: hypothetical protein A2289_15535 [Deltaproteobacteria bacterium RIFOXYA12_FULL_58_15]OGR14656.1 MAG: hypothetical protein A2341_22220 [Deltaproteobacteria bacterium RIFOXYB12_FULL_58_9]